MPLFLLAAPSIQYFRFKYSCHIKPHFINIMHQNYQYWCMEYYTLSS